MTYQILTGDTIEQMATLPEQSVQMSVTSPPYWGLRDYGVEGQIGLEESPAAYVEKMVEVMRGVWRVLRDDGTLWLNVGDSYNGSGGVGGAGKQHTNQGAVGRPDNRAGHVSLKPKDLCLIPYRLVLALQDDGWWVRSQIVWAKKSSMPESVRDRPTSAWEPIFLLTKSQKYFYDAEAVRQPGAQSSGPRRQRADLREQEGYNEAHFGNPPIRKRDRPQHASLPGRGDKDSNMGLHDGYNGSPTSNLRNVWHLGPEPFPDAHFATFPTEIPRRAILAGTKKGDTVLDPFMGSGTTLLVAEQLGRDSVGIELNPEYAAMAERRIQKGLPVTQRKNTEDPGAFRLT